MSERYSPYQHRLRKGLGREVVEYGKNAPAARIFGRRRSDLQGFMINFDSTDPSTCIERIFQAVLQGTD